MGLDKAIEKRGFQYADGGESDLLELYQNGFDAEKDWLTVKSNWPLYYHTSPLRKNIVKWYFDGVKSNNLRVLEIGAGCGAITSHLVKSDRIQSLTSIEGETKRINVIKKRCQGYESKLTLINKNIEDLNETETYDVVVVIGVLEYSGRYINSDKPYLDFVKSCFKFLKPGGELLLAIENQLGHKYIAGNNEDHYGIPYCGVSGYPKNDGIRTFDKSTLSELLTKGGFNGLNWYYPFPDYKFPRVIFSESAFDKAITFNWMDLIDTPSEDRSNKSKLLINERQFLAIAAKNIEPGILMNSFCVVAKKSSLMTDPVDFLAIKFNSHRSKSFKTNIKFKKNENDDILVIRNDNEIEPYFKGYSTLFNLITDSSFLGKKNETDHLMNTWVEVLSGVKQKEDALCRKEFDAFCQSRIGKSGLYPESKNWVQFGYFDLTPYNILYNTVEKSTKIIDLEWNQFDIKIPVELVIDRGIYYLCCKLLSLGIIDQVYDSKNQSWGLKTQGIKTSLRDYQEMRIVEHWFQNYVYTEQECLSNEGLNSELKRLRNELHESVLGSIKRNLMSRLASFSWIRRIAQSVNYHYLQKNVQ